MLKSKEINKIRNYVLKRNVLTAGRLVRLTRVF